jgi:23S rRNA pseudouridine955/2504/2580 synthase
MEYVISNQFHDVRLDRWVRHHFPGVPQSLIEKALRHKDIVLNNRKAKSSDRICSGDSVEIRKHFETVSHNTNLQYKYSKEDYLKLVNNILFESDEYIVLNKPSGVSVQGGSFVRKSVIDILNSNNNSGSVPSYKIVHRIDKETTGVLILAKTLSAARYFSELFRANNIHKTYLAVACGVFKSNHGIMQNNLLKVHDKVIESSDGKDSISEFKVLKTLDKKYTLVQVVPVTGRMHQIRVQLALMGHPILGDGKYNISKAQGNLKLHALEIEFVDMHDKIMKFTAPLPPDFLYLGTQEV